MGRLLVAAGVGASYLLMATAVWFGLGAVNLGFYRRLAAEGVRTDATVTATDCGNHNVFRYTFATADGRAVDGHGTPGAGNPPCDHLARGGAVSVWYVPADPAVNWPGDPGWRLHNELVSVRMAAFGMPALLFGILGITYRFGRR